MADKLVDVGINGIDKRICHCRMSQAHHIKQRNINLDINTTLTIIIYLHFVIFVKARGTFNGRRIAYGHLFVTFVLRKLNIKRDNNLYCKEKRHTTAFATVIDFSRHMAKLCYNKIDIAL